MMGEHLPIGRGPRPWREPRAFADWVVTLEWLQLTSLIAGTAMLAFLNWALADLDAIACFDRDRAACGREESARWFGCPNSQLPSSCTRLRCSRS